MTTGPYTGLATTFDTAADIYEQARPRYPARLFDDLAVTTGLDSSTARVLEIGAGTGKATRGLLARGWSVVALEPGRELAAVARRVLAGLGEVEVVESPFEQWDADGAEPFDLVVAATSWHWLDHQVAYRRAAQLLRPGGHLAIVATTHVCPTGADDFFNQVQPVYERLGLGDGSDGPEPPGKFTDPDVEAIRASGCFEEPVVHRYVWGQDYTAEQYLTLLSTYSGHIAMPAAQRQALFAEIRRMIAARPAGTVRKYYLNMVQTARRAG
ncbi:class I SAM-dependent methyltransferase [Actinoplanes sp. TRM 88003]|uniref:Class I SAM-dependent methyltransferase n=1 Tax=Paractinoplanes aksuensis TaxID=2939490 RepID=A0ABT1DFN9_9ACTN|nr:class I SAM-dependent methyltransferase [Actinoplanes aksuensis]MCO8269610.1 class I SAM-dependent methyltransferase [Actinoplanes aksuensis]